jgi:hypothetical protein
MGDQSVRFSKELISRIARAIQGVAPQWRLFHGYEKVLKISII